MAVENSFDIVCKVDAQEVTNAVDQTRREIETRYDLKGTRSEIEQEKTVLTVSAPDDMKLKAVVDILQSKLHRRGVPLKALSYGKVESAAGGNAQAEDRPPAGHTHREGARDRPDGQGHQAQAAGGHPGGQGPRVRQES
jgi:uncharacterized protein YajQ (UPF0234 family)